MAKAEALAAAKETEGALRSWCEGFTVARSDSEGMGKPFGIDLAGAMGSDATMTFTSNSIDVGGQSMKCKFEVDGQRVKVIPEGQAASLIFVMQDKDTALLDMGLMKMRYKRVD